MSDVSSIVSEELLEVSSEQRLGILLLLSDNSLKLSDLSKSLDATASEVHRNINRLLKKKLVSKNSEGHYELTTYGTMVIHQIPNWLMFAEKSNYFTSHGFDALESRFIQQIGSLAKSTHHKGFVKVQDVWKELYDTSSEYIYNMLFEVSYEDDILELLNKKLSDGISIKTIFSSDAIVSNKRKEILKKYDFQKYFESEQLQRKMNKNLKTLVILNEKSACVMFPTSNDEIDVSELLYSDDEQFHQWCLDLFLHTWSNSSSFRDDKLQ